MAPCAPATVGTYRPSIPVRNSSISHAGETNRHNGLVGGHMELARNLFDQSSTTAVEEHPKDTSTTSEMDLTAASRSETTRDAHPAKAQRWAGLTRSVSGWDNLRKDPDLWFEDGDCQVHLHALGASRRGPSFCVPLRALRQKKCGAMLKICHAQMAMHTSSPHQGTQQIHSFHHMPRGSGVVELYIPAPDLASRGDSFNWHLTTRNFFAYVLGAPLVGHHMGQTFVNLLERMQLYRDESVDSHHDFLEYAENQGYRDLVECTDYALASLYYAEHYRLRPVWVDAFAHCVGMNDSLALSPEYKSISRLTKALITRAYLEVDTHLRCVAKALRTFLQDDLSPTFLGLSDEARNHQDRFRRFLHQFYVEKFGYWPPPKNVPSFPKVLYKSMFYDFQSLYDYLADTSSTIEIASQRPASGGICVLQNLDSFDKRHKFTARPHPLPLLPDRQSLASKESQSLARTLSSASQHRKSRDPQFTMSALAAATNSFDGKAANSKIVQAYIQFEQTCTVSSRQREGKLTAIDARKVRWLVIYGTLQYLVSALRAPKEVRDTEGAEYPLCCLVAGQSSLHMGTPVSSPPASKISSAATSKSDYFGEAQCSPFLIQPDCQRGDYFTSQNASRRQSIELPAHPKVSMPMRQPSLRSFGPLSSLSTRVSRRNSLTLKPTAHCPIFVHGYGNGLNEASTKASTRSVSQVEAVVQSHRSLQPDTLAGPNAELSWLNPGIAPAVTVQAPPNLETHGPCRTRTPLLLSSQLEIFAQPVPSNEPNDSMSRSDSTSSTASSVWTAGDSVASSKSSAHGEHQHAYKASAAEHSGLLGGLVSFDGTPCTFNKIGSTTSTVSLSQADVHPLLRQNTMRQDGFDFDFGAQSWENYSPAYSPDTIGVASSGPPTPLAHGFSAPQVTSLRKISLTGDLELLQPETTSADTTVVPSTPINKKKRHSDIFSGLGRSPTTLRERCNSMLERREVSETVINPKQYGDLGSSSSSTPDAHPPSVTMTTHAVKEPSLRSRIWHDDGKKERRLSSLWRR